jgi:hypothetical protein
VEFLAILEIVMKLAKPDNIDLCVKLVEKLVDLAELIKEHKAEKKSS